MTYKIEFPSLTAAWLAGQEATTAAKRAGSALILSEDTPLTELSVLSKKFGGFVCNDGEVTQDDEEKINASA